MISDRKLIRTAEKCGARNIMIINPRDAVTGIWVRYKCRYGCGAYNSSLVCPPYTPEPETTRKMLDEYKRAVLFEGGRDRVKELAVKMEKEFFYMGYYKAFGLGAGPCRLCRECSFEECRYPEDARPALEACGIDVFATVRKHGYKIDVVGENEKQARFFGMILVE